MNAARAGCVVAMALCLGACATEEKVVRYKPFLTGIEGAKFGQEPVLGDPRVTPADPTEVPDNKIVREEPDGSKTLIARSPVHVMQHVERCLDENEDDLLLEQMVAQSTKDYYAAQGKDPKAFIRELHAKRKDIAKLFARMPQGESSPTVLLRQLPDRVWRIDVVGGFAKDLRLTRLWVQMERGQWKLMWVD